MPVCIHQLALCPDCGGLQVTEYMELNGIAKVELDGADGRLRFTGETRAFWSPGPPPCEPDRSPSHNS